MTEIKTPWFEGAARGGWCETAVYKTRTGTLDACVGTWDARRGTLEHQVWDVGT